MKKILTTFGFGQECHDCLEIVVPGFQAYAKRHWYVLQEPDNEAEVFAMPYQFGWPTKCIRAASWYKIPWFCYLFETHNADAILWLDADCCVFNPAIDILDQVGTKWQGLVEYHQDEGYHLNCGVWLLRREMLPILREIWAVGNFMACKWWEQDALMYLMGLKGPGPGGSWGDLTNPLLCNTAILPADWNWTYYSKVNAEAPYIGHCTGRADRVDRLKHWVHDGKPSW